MSAIRYLTALQEQHARYLADWFTLKHQLAHLAADSDQAAGLRRKLRHVEREMTALEQRLQERAP